MFDTWNRSSADAYRFPLSLLIASVVRWTGMWSSAFSAGSPPAWTFRFRRLVQRYWSVCTESILKCVIKLICPVYLLRYRNILNGLAFFRSRWLQITVSNWASQANSNSSVTIPVGISTEKPRKTKRKRKRKTKTKNAILEQQFDYNPISLTITSIFTTIELN